MVIFVLQQQGTNGGNGPNKRRMPEPEVTARCRRLITGGQDSSIQGALPGWKVLEHFTKAFCVHNQPRTGYTVVSVNSSMIVLNGCNGAGEQHLSIEEQAGCR